MYEFLEDIPDEELIKESKHKIKSSINIRDNFNSRQEILRILFAIFGYDILYETTIRRLLLTYCSEELFFELCDKYNFDKTRKRFDLSVELSTLPWRPGSKITKDFKRIFNIPRNYLPLKLKGQTKFEIINGKETLGELFDYQKEISENIHHFLKLDTLPSCLVQMPTGSGKTRTALESIVDYIKQQEENDSIKVLWVAHSEELLEQAIDTLKKIWSIYGSGEIGIGRLWGSYDSLEEIDEINFMFVGYMKLVSLQKNNTSYFSEIINNFNLTIVDEAHKSASTLLSHTLKKIINTKTNKIIGLTATPGRSSFDRSENIKLISLYSNNLITSNILGENPIKYLQDRGILSRLVPIEVEAGISVDLSEKELLLIDKEQEIPTTILKKLANNKKRNDVLVSIIVNEVLEKRTVLVFCCSVDHSKKISVLLASKGVVSASVDYTMRTGARRHIVHDFKMGNIKVLLNYGIFSTGLDVPKLDTVVISRPTSSVVLYSQMIGRGIRGNMVGGTEECRLIDIRDNFLNYGDVDSVYQYFKDDWSRG